MLLYSLFARGLLLAGVVHAIDLNPDDPESIKNGAKIAAKGMLKWYTGMNPGDVPGNLPDPYYWWEAGAMFAALVDYYYYTGDDEWNNITTQAMLHQVGPDNNYMPPNQSSTLGNDDQAFWGMAALTAAETKYPDPPEDQPQWLALAQAVFNTQAPRWDTSTCGGGLRWQIYQFNNGYNYKNTISLGAFFNMAARLARYTGNDTYADWANRAWDWGEAIGLMSPNYEFYDGTDDTLNCSSINHIQWTYNAGIFLYGAASMWNKTGSDLWKTRVDGILAKTTATFFQNGVMTEVACEGNGLCNVDQRSFKAYLSRWMGVTTKVAPWTAATITPLLRTSAAAAARNCVGGDDGQTCGLRWTQAGFDGSVGVGEQMSALEVMQNLLVDRVAGPVTNASGGTSKGDYSAGTDGAGDEDPRLAAVHVTTGDRVGAGILTTLVLAGLLGGGMWMVSEEWE